MIRNPWSLLGVAGLALLIGAAATIPVQATVPGNAIQRQIQNAPLPQGSTESGVSDNRCLECHNDPTLSMALENGELVSLHVDPEVYHDSVHGQESYDCVQCHTRVGDYPHPTFTAADRRDFRLQLNTVCQRCHIGQFEATQDSVHQRAQLAGNREAAVCADCHGFHDIRRLTDPASGDLLPESRAWIPQACARCHSQIYENYLTSVHGVALTLESNPDVPTCIDCHGVHNIADPTTTAFRLASPQLCAGCHTDPTVMEPYGLSTQVLDTYVADFHGTTVTLFSKQSPDAETNKPVCYDCHGVHDIPRIDDPDRGLQARENLLSRCQECHPDATINFPDAWMSHYIPGPDRNPLVYYVNLFYRIFIPSLLGGMAILVVLDLSSKVRARRNRPAPDEAQPPDDADQTAHVQTPSDEIQSSPALPGTEKSPRDSEADADE